MRAIAVRSIAFAVLAARALSLEAGSKITCPANAANPPPHSTVVVQVKAVKTADNSYLDWGIRVCYDIVADPSHAGNFLDCLHFGNQNTTAPLVNRFADCDGGITVAALPTPNQYTLHIDAEAKYVVFYALGHNASAVEWYGAAENTTTGQWEWATYDCFCNDLAYCPKTACGPIPAGLKPSPSPSRSSLFLL